MRGAWWLAAATATALWGAGEARLADAAKHLDLAAVRAMIEQHADVNAAGPDGTTALHWAANQDDLEIAALLVKAGAKLDVADAQGRTPMRWAKGEFIALHPPEEKPSTVVLIEKLSK